MDIKQILIVDDSVDDIHFVMENMKQEYAVLAATSGEKALEIAARDPRPDVILLDVMMPGVDGYETCRRLKDKPETQDIDVIFVSAHDTTDEKLAGYDAGGSDYLIKPVQPEELLQKVKLAIKNKEARATASEEKSMAMETAMTAISSAGEQGVVLDFMRQSYTTNDFNKLAKLIVDSTGNYGLKNSVQIRTNGHTFNASTTESIPPLEKEILTRLKDAGRLQESGTRLMANYGNISLLVKNMPDDPDMRGRLRDHLAILLESAEARLDALEISNGLGQLISDSNETLQQIEVMQKDQKSTAMEIMDHVMEDLEEAFMSYGLTEDQESLLLGVVQAGVDKSLDNFEKGLIIDEQLRGLITRLEVFQR